MTQSSLNQIAMQERTRREILHKSDLIPPLPDLVTRVLGVLNRQDTEPEDLEKLLAHDQVLVAKLLAMVNSPFYGINRKIRTVKEAVMVLGFRGVRSLVLATSTAKFLQRDFGWYGHQPKGLWLHAICVASGARLLGNRCGMSPDECEQVFVGGLLHDIGKLLLVPYLQGATPPEPDECECGLERRLIGIDHTEAGALVAQKWNLPEEIHGVIAGQHDNLDADDADSLAQAVAVVRLADGVACQLGIGFLAGRQPPTAPKPEDMQLVGIADSWDTVSLELADNMEEAVRSLGELSA